MEKASTEPAPVITAETAAKIRAAVERGTQEWSSATGVRMAFGAQSASVSGMVVKLSAAIAGIGFAVGPATCRPAGPPRWIRSWRCGRIEPGEDFGGFLWYSHGFADERLKLAFSLAI